jgi:MoaA/NifB/PqqE/SkfB family radical SAM enzyme
VDPSPTHPAAIAARVARWAGAGPQGPVTLELYPTLVCNLDCAFCDTTTRHRPAVDELPAARLLDILDEAAAMGAARLMVLGGGEPLIRRDATPALLRRARAHGMEGMLTTNGTLMGPDIARLLLDIAWTEVHVSVDGALRGQAGAFKRTIQNTCRLLTWRRAAGLRFPEVALHFVLTNRNLHQLTEMVELAASLGAVRVDFDALVAYRPAQQALALTPAERARVPGLARAAWARAETLGIATTLPHFFDAAHLDRGSAPPPRPPGAGLHGAPCLKAWHHLVVQADGRTSPCCVLAGEGGSARSTPLAEVWASDPLLGAVRAGMAAGTPLPRCRECSWNILAHEAVIRSHLPAEAR